MNTNQRKGQRSYYQGLAAENCVLRHYEEKGYRTIRSRWRGDSGEIDLVLRNAGGLVFVEVKSGSSHSVAARKLTAHQIERIMSAALEYLALSEFTAQTSARFDFATVDRFGAVSIVENAFM